MPSPQTASVSPATSCTANVKAQRTWFDSVLLFCLPTVPLTCELPARDLQISISERKWKNCPIKGNFGARNSQSWSQRVNGIDCQFEKTWEKRSPFHYQLGRSAGNWASKHTNLTIARILQSMRKIKTHRKACVKIKETQSKIKVWPASHLQQNVACVAATRQLRSGRSDCAHWFENLERDSRSKKRGFDLTVDRKWESKRIRIPPKQVMAFQFPNVTTIKPSFHFW